MSLIEKGYFKNFIALFLGCILSFFILEIFLRIYNPFGFRVKGDKIILYPYKKYVIENFFGKRVFHSKNAIGFRGEEPPANFSDYLTIIAIGGSTTECFYLNDGKTWPEVLGKKLKLKFKNVWINNAGLDGQSTYGHLILLKDYILKIKPKIAVFYCGLNDLGLSQLNRYESEMEKGGDSIIKRFIKFLAHWSETVSTGINVVHFLKTKKIDVKHGNLKDIKRINVSHKEIEKAIEGEKYNLHNYSQRLKEIIKVCRENNIEPVFITQAMLCGDWKDEKTGDYLGDLAINNKFLTFTGHALALDMYNGEMKRVARENNVFVIDAARLMPKSSEYYYDCVHFTESGALKFVEVIFPEFYKFLKNKYNRYSL